MIRMVRGPEPPELERARGKRLEKLREVIRSEKRDPVSKEITGYDLPAVKDSLHEGQGKKCCYCENDIAKRFDPIEHYRPKSIVSKDGATPERPGYWWLAYTWENLLYACDKCNGEKSSQFPLAAGSTPLSAEQAPPGAEAPLLLNPYDEDPARNPVDLIEFRKTESRGKDTWEAFPRHGDERARRTIDDIVKLNRDGLVKPYRDHVSKMVSHHVRAVRLELRADELKHGNARPLWRAYATAVRSLLKREHRFSALSYDALRHFVPDSDLVPHLHRPWPRPPVDVP